MNHNRFQRQTDKGWQSMSELLDQEMPQKRRRRFGWWFLGLLLMPLAAGAGWLMLQLDKELTKTTTPHNKPTAQPAASVVTTLQHSNNTFPTAISPNTAAVDEQESLQAATGSDFPPLGISRESAREWSQKDPYAPVTMVAALELNDAVFVSDPEEIRTLGMLPSEFQLLENQSNIHSSLPLVTPVSRANATPPKKATRPGKWQVGATLGLASERFTAANSALTGLTVDWQPLRRWGLRSGMMYEYYKPSGIARPIAEVDAMDYADATRNHSFLFRSGVYVPGTSEALGLDVALPVTLIHRLRAPLLAYWKPARWMRLYGGTSFCYTLRAQTSNKGLAFDNELVASKTATSASKVNKLATNELPRFQTQLQTGLGVHIGKRWEVDFAYQQAAKIQFKSIFDKRQEDGLYNSSQTNHRPNYHFFTLSGILYF